jgi:acetyl esterase/lipase
MFLKQHLGPATTSARQSRVPTGAIAHRDLEYIPGGHERHKLDLLLPPGDGPFPVIVWVHGGAWRAGSKGAGPALAFVDKGYAVASVNYRLSQHAVFPAQIEDCKAALRWLRANAAHYKLDRERFAVWGSSAGGHLVALLGTAGDRKQWDMFGGNTEQSSRVQCVVDWFGPTDFLQMGGRHNDANSPESQLVGGAIQEHKEKVAAANPITYVTPDDPPFLIMHGQQDNTVPPNQSELLATALKKAGVSVDHRVIPGAGHGGPAFGNPDNIRVVTEFLDRHLKPASSR